MPSGRSWFCGKCVIAVMGAAILSGVAFLYSGLYPIGADVPHDRLTSWALRTLRERSIASAARDIQEPADLNQPDRLLKGGADYNDMCAGCHLRPGRTKSDFTLGLSPAPPNLAASQGQDPAGRDVDARHRRRFWIIKHGIKASGMPAWAPGHDDERIWNMVAFLDRLPELTPEQYQILTARDDDAGDHH